MRTLAGSDAEVHFTNLSRSSSQSLSTVFGQFPDVSLAKAFCHQSGVLDLIKQTAGNISLETVCLLDPKAEKELSPDDGQDHFQWFLFGVSTNATLNTHLLCCPIRPLTVFMSHRESLVRLRLVKTCPWC